jgi:hypothetical protein
MHGTYVQNRAKPFEFPVQKESNLLTIHRQFLIRLAEQVAGSCSNTTRDQSRSYWQSISQYLISWIVRARKASGTFPRDAEGSVKIQTSPKSQLQLDHATGGKMSWTLDRHHSKPVRCRGWQQTHGAEPGNSKKKK